MSAGDYEIVPYRPDLAGATAALHATFVPGRKPAEAEAILAWKYDANPYLPERLIFLALHEGKPVGMRGFFGSCWQADGRRAIIPCTGDLVIAPDHRNRGLMPRLTEAGIGALRARGYSHLFSLSAGEVTALGARAMGFKPVAPADWHVRRVARSPWLRHAARLFNGAPQFRRFDRAMRRAPREGALTVSADARPAAMAELLTRLGDDGRLRHVRDEAYFGWRFRNPAAAFRFVFAGGARLSGYLVLATQIRQPHMPVHIADWEGEDAAAKRALLEAAIAQGQFDGLAAWAFGLDAEDRRILADLGFCAEGRTGVRGFGTTMLVKTLGQATPKSHETPIAEATILDPSRWRFRMIYSDYC